MAAQGAIAAIRKGCELLQEGKTEVERVKKAVAEAKAIVAEAQGIWDTIKGIWASLTGTKPKPSTSQAIAAATVAVEPAAKPAKGKAKDEFEEHIPDELEIVSRVGENIAKFMRLQAQWVAYYEAEKERIFSGEGMDETQGEAALKLVLVETQMVAMGTELREMMTINCPPQLGPLWSKFNEMYRRISDEQSAHRERERIARQHELWRQYQSKSLRIERVLALVGAVFAIALMWGVMLSLSLLVKTLAGFRG